MDLSAREVASVVEVDVATVSRWERGKTRPSGEPAGRLGDLIEQWLEVLGEEFR